MQTNQLVFQFLDTTGTGVGSKNAIGNYASPTDFYIENGNPRGKMAIARLLVYIRDTGTFTAGSYGAASALSNGILVKVEYRDVTQDLTDNIPILTNADWARVCYDADVKSWGAGDAMLGVRWTFEKSGAPVLIGQGEKLIVRVNDNMTDLAEHRFMVQGRYV